MPSLNDFHGNALRNLDAIAGEALIDTRTDTFGLAALNSEKIIDLAGEATGAVDVRNAFTGIFNVEYSINGVDYVSQAVYNTLTKIFLLNISAAGSYVFNIPAGCKRVRIRVVGAITSGTPIISFRASKKTEIVLADKIPATSHGKIIGTTGAVATAACNSAPGMYVYLTNVKIQCFATAALTAAATSQSIAVTNMPSTREYRIPQPAAAQGTFFYEIKETYNNPIRSTAAGTVVNFNAPAMPGVQVYINVDFYLGF